MHHAGMQSGGEVAVPQPGLSGIEFLSGDVMTRLWDRAEGDVLMAAAKKKKPAKKKPGKKPAKKTPKKKPKKKPRPTRHRPGCDSTDPTCITNPSSR